MKFVKLLIILSVLTALSLGAARTRIPGDWPDPESFDFERITIDPPEPERYAFDNGLVVYLLEDRALPLIDGVAYVGAPSVFDPDNQVSLASITAAQLREGGAGGRGPDELDDALEFLAASVEASANDFFTSVSFSSLSDNIDEVLEVFADVLRAPEFDEGRLDTYKGRFIESIRRQNDQPSQIAFREFYYRVAEGHPSGYYATEAMVDSISREDVIRFHEQFYAPNATIMAVTGDFDSAEMLEKLEAAFGDWEAKEIDTPELPPFNPNPEPRIYHAPREVGQSIIVAGHPTMETFDEGYAALSLANAVLGGGGFTSRLVREIRTNRGLAYSTGSAITESFDYPALFIAYSFTRTDRTGEALELLIAEIERMQQEPVSAAELDTQRDRILNGEVFRYTSVAGVTQRTARVELLGLEQGYYERYIEDVQAVTPEDILAAAQQHFQPAELVIMVVGDDAQFDRPLNEFGEVITIELE